MLQRLSSCFSWLLKALKVITCYIKMPRDRTGKGTSSNFSSHLTCIGQLWYSDIFTPVFSGGWLSVWYVYVHPSESDRSSRTYVFSDVLWTDVLCVVLSVLIHEEIVCGVKWRFSCLRKWVIIYLSAVICIVLIIHVLMQCSSCDALNWQTWGQIGYF